MRVVNLVLAARIVQQDRLRAQRCDHDPAPAQPVRQPGKPVETAYTLQRRGKSVQDIGVGIFRGQGVQDMADAGDGHVALADTAERSIRMRRQQQRRT